MSTAVYPPLSGPDILQRRAETTQRELAWLLAALQETLQSLKAGLDECAVLLEPRESGSTLVLSSQRSENLKGFVTLNGTRIVKGDIQLRLPSLIPPRGQNSVRLAVSTAPTAPDLVVRQLVAARTLINSCLDVVDATLWTGDVRNADYMSSQLRLLHENVQDARDALRGGAEGPSWCDDIARLDKAVFEPPLPQSLSLHFSVQDAALILTVRTLQVAEQGGSGSAGANTPTSTYGYAQSFSGLGIRDRLAAVLTGAPQSQRHDEADEVFTYKGQSVRVREKLRVESQDPSLMVALAKLGALEHSVAISRKALDVVMDREDDGVV